MKSINLILLLLLVQLSSYATSDNHLSGARSSAMANASVASTDLWANYNNQAALARIDKIQAGVFYENRFQLKDLSTKAISLYVPTKLGGFNLNYSQFGSDLYKERKIGFGYSKALSKHSWASVQLNQILVKLNQTYGEQSRFNFEIGLLAEIFQDFSWDFTYSIPVRKSLKPCILMKQSQALHAWDFPGIYLMKHCLMQRSKKILIMIFA